MAKPRLLSGIKPTGAPHLGNYFGAMRQFVSLAEKHDTFVMIADYHALNQVQNAAMMRKNIETVLLDYLAIGLDPKKVTIFKQSAVPAHTELCWIFDTITTMPYLMRAHAFKDAEAKNKDISVGTFNYPMLMAADILLYQAGIVPVGHDQRQHIEIARDTAYKFHTTFCKEGEEVFTIPQEHVVDDVAIVPGIDGRKMSKSYNNTIPLFATRAEITKAVMAIVTNSSGDKPEHVYNIHRLLKPAATLDPIYAAHTGKFKALKDMLIEDLDTFIAPLRERRAALEANSNSILATGAIRANEIATNTLTTVKKAIGVL
jgi:tryptophanyl-tRNA synthetase